MNEGKKPAREIAVGNGFGGKLENFWYHYKWVVIGVAFALIVVLVCVLQTCSTEKNDTVIVYAGPTYLSVSETEQLRQVMDQILPADFDGNGKKHAQMSMYEIYSEEQFHSGVDRNRNSTEYQNYHTYQQTGESTIYLLDPWLYESMDKAYLCPLTDTVGVLPEGALADGYGVRLGDTALYRDNAAVRLLPADTVVCMMVNVYTPFGKPAMDEEEYQCEKDMLRALVTYVGKETVAE
ncbi:MAG: hypothetical protein IJW44_01375 [Clostridia bacterium]|nr:hypothetical protein [Clostridia bacterium]